MSVKYTGVEPIIMQNGKVIKNNEIVPSMSDTEGKSRKGFEVVTEKKTEIKESKQRNQHE